MKRQPLKEFNRYMLQIDKTLRGHRTAITDIITGRVLVIPGKVNQMDAIKAHQERYGCGPLPS